MRRARFETASTNGPAPVASRKGHTKNTTTTPSRAVSTVIGRQEVGTHEIDVLGQRGGRGAAAQRADRGTRVQQLAHHVPANVARRADDQDPARCPLFRHAPTVGRPAPRFLLVVGRRSKGGATEDGPVRRLDLAPDARRGRWPIDVPRQHAGQLGVREWLEELRDLFGERMAEQVVGRAAERGRGQAHLEFDPDSVTPSVELVQDTTGAEGSRPPDRLARLRRLVDRVARDLVRP
jgi:hypothetical protein